MTEFEIIDDKLVMVCEHEWSPWFQTKETENGMIEKSVCYRCGEYKMIVPRGYIPHPRKLPARSSFSLFLADFKARFNK